MTQIPQIPVKSTILGNRPMCPGDVVDVQYIPLATAIGNSLTRGSDGLYVPFAAIQPLTFQRVVSALTVTPAFTDDVIVVSAQSVPLVIANPSGTPVDGHKFVLHIKGNGTVQALSFGSAWAAYDAPLPSVTEANSWITLTAYYNGTSATVDVTNAHPVIPQQIINVVYFNPATGSDAAAGTFQAPIQTVARALAMYPLGGFTLRATPGAVVKEDIDLSAVSGVRLEGWPGKPMILQGTQLFTNAITKTAGKTITYQVNGTHTWTAVGGRGYPGIIEYNPTKGTTTRLTNISPNVSVSQGGVPVITGVTDDASAATYVDAHAGTFCMQTDEWAAGWTTGSKRYYFTSSDGTDPTTNGYVYSFVQHKYPNLGTGNHLENAIAVCGYEHGGLVGYKCGVKNVWLYWPAAHASELPGCWTDRLTIEGSSIFGYTGIAVHHFGPHANKFDAAVHRNLTVRNWTGQFQTAIGIHTDDATPITGTLIYFDGLNCSNVASVLGGNTVSLVYIKNLTAIDCNALGTAGCSTTIEGGVGHFYDAGAIQAPTKAGKTLTLNDFECTSESLLFTTKILSGAVVINRGAYIQVGVEANNAWNRQIAVSDGWTFNDCVITAPIGSPGARVGTDTSGGAVAASCTLNRCTVGRELTVNAAWVPGGIVGGLADTNVYCDPQVNQWGDGGVKISLDSPHHFRLMRAVKFAGAFNANTPNDVMVLTDAYVLHANTLNGTFAGNPVYTLPGVRRGIKYIGDASTGKKFIAFGDNGTLDIGAQTAGTWSAITTGLTKNWYCAAGNYNNGQGNAILGASDGTLTSYDGVVTLANIATTNVNALYGGFYINPRWVFVGAAGTILTMTGTIGAIGAITTVAGTTGTDTLRAVAGSGTSYCAVGDGSVIYYTVDNWVTTLRIVLNWPINLNSVAVNQTTGDVLITGTPSFGKIAAYKSNIADMSVWNQVYTPLDVITSCVWRKVFTTATPSPDVWMITGPAYRAYYSENMVDWTPANPFFAKTKPIRTYAEDALINAVVKDLT